MAISIDLYCNDGSPLGITPPDIYGRGVGGAELAMMSWAETMASRGHEVRVFNNPISPGFYGGVEYLPQYYFDPADRRDVFVIFRSPNRWVRLAKAGLKIHWSTDQFTVGNFATDIFPWVDKVVCISPYHVEYHRHRYGIQNGKIGHIDLGVKAVEYDQEIEREPGRLIFCSIPDRGLPQLRQAWTLIKERVPHASLVITSDYRLWGAPMPGNHQHRLKWADTEDVIFLGRVPRQHLVREQLAAECQAYPCIYEELFCISAAECQVAGAVPVTSAVGALGTTNEFGKVLDGNPLAGDWQNVFVDAIAATLEIPEEERRARQQRAAARFDWNVICEQWEKLIETGEFA